MFYKNLSFLEVFYGLFNIVKFGGYLVIVIKEIYGKKKLWMVVFFFCEIKNYDSYICGKNKY